MFTDFAPSLDPLPTSWFAPADTAYTTRPCTPPRRRTRTPRSLTVSRSAPGWQSLSLSHCTCVTVLVSLYLCHCKNAKEFNGIQVSSRMAEPRLLRFWTPSPPLLDTVSSAVGHVLFRCWTRFLLLDSSSVCQWSWLNSEGAQQYPGQEGLTTRPGSETSWR